MNQLLIDVLIVDDHAFFRNILLRLLENNPHIHIVGTAANGYEALDTCHIRRPDVILMDLSMGMMNGLTATAEIQRQYPKTNILILTGMENHNQAIAAFEAGAAGYLRKDSITPENLIAAIQCVANDGIYIDPHVFAILLPTWHKDAQPAIPDPLVSDLTANEHNLLRRVALGQSNQEIAQTEKVSSKTIANKLSMLFNAIEVNGRVQATHFALRHSIIHLDETAV